MRIEYKTEGRLALSSGSASTDAAVLSWVKGDDRILLLQGSSGKVTLSKKQLLDLALIAESVADDLQPNMNSLPRPA